MQPVFTRLNQSIRLSIDYYNTGRIKDHFFRFAKTELVYITPHHLDTHYELVFDLHSDMEDEINQVIHTCDYNTQVYFFELLKNWLFDYRIESLNISLIEEKINEYNDKTYADFLIGLKKEVEEFQQAPNFHREHKEEYEVTRPDTMSFLFGNGYRPPITKKYTNYKYYCIEKSPELIDISYLNNYLPIVNNVICNFRNIVLKYVKLYEEGKILPANKSVIELSNFPQQKLLGNETSVQSLLQKLKFQGTPKEFVKIFAPLINERKIIFKSELKGDTDPIAKLLHSYFEISKETGKGEISVGTLQTYFKNNNSVSGSKSKK